MAGERSVVDWLEAGIRCLAHAEGEELEQLAAAAHLAAPPETAEEERRAREKLQTLGLLLALTRRNLRLLQHGAWSRVRGGGEDAAARALVARRDGPAAASRRGWGSESGRREED